MNRKVRWTKVSKVQVQLYWLGWSSGATPKRYPTTASHGSFWLLGFPPDPVRPSLANLGISDSSVAPMVMTSLVRTLGRRGPMRIRTPSLTLSSTLSLQVAGSQKYATTSGCWMSSGNSYITYSVLLSATFCLVYSIACSILNVAWGFNNVIPMVLHFWPLYA